MKTNTLLGSVGATVSIVTSATAAMVVSFDSAAFNSTTIFETIGFEFEVNSPIRIDGLGSYDDSKDGLSAAVEVGLWTAAGSPLAQVTVPAGAGAPLDNWFRWQTLPSTLTLNPGRYVVGAMTQNPGEPFGWQPSSFTTVPEVAFVEDRYSWGSPLQYPSSTTGFNGWYGGNVHVAVPEAAGTAVLAGLGLLGFAASRRFGVY